MSVSAFRPLMVSFSLKGAALCKFSSRKTVTLSVRISSAISPANNELTGRLFALLYAAVVDEASVP